MFRMLSRFFNWLQSPLKAPEGVPQYGLRYFEHLLGLYEAIASDDLPGDDRNKLDAIRNLPREQVGWKDIYAFDLLILKYLKLNQLKSRVLTLRSRFLSVAGQGAFDAYLSSNPPDPASETDEDKLRRDIEFLLNEFYLRYSLLSAREHMRSNLLKLAALFTLLFVIAGAVLIIMSSTGLFTPEVTTIPVVMFAGIIGSFVSMQHRIQSAPSQGDPVYNFSVLTHGVFGIFLSPVSGAIFAVVLYLLFAGKVIEGKMFPEFTPKQSNVAASSIQSNVQESNPKEQPTDPNKPKEQTSEPSKAKEQSSGTSTPTPSPTPTPPVKLKHFLNDTGPASSVDFALLVIWAFLAGFAERLVPDALSRLVARTETTRGGSA